GLLLPAVQKVREAAARVTCQNNLKQLALAMHSYENSHSRLPPGLAHSGSDGRYTSVWVELLPYMEQSNLSKIWDYTTPINNFNSAMAPGAAAMKTWICPSQGVVENPTTFGNLFYGMTTYGVTGGTKTFPPELARADGVFSETGPQSKPRPHLQPVRVAGISDGMSNTILIGERNIYDANLDSYQTAPMTPEPTIPRQTMAAYAPWGSPPGPNAAATVLLSSEAGINFGFPTKYLPPLPPTPEIPENWGIIGPDWNKRITAFGSRHSGGSNFAFADGSVRFITQTVKPESLTAYCTRAGDEVVTD
ncbi:MAG: DUF1559 domain-containing protein, partial [Gemmataceae bacterium]